MKTTAFARHLAAIAVAAAVGALSVSPASAQVAPPKDQFLSMGTSSAGGSFYPLGGAMAAVIGKHFPQLKINAEITGGAVDNVKLLNSGKLELALISSQVIYEGAKGQGKFAEAGPQTKHVALMAGHGNVWQLYALKSHGVATLEDLKGKKISLGATGSDGNSIGKLVLEAHGLTMGSDWTPEYLSHGDGPGALRDSRVDAVLIISSTPTGAVTDITSTAGADVAFINPKPDVLADLLGKNPYWAAASIPGGLYNGHPDDITGTFKQATILCARTDLSEEAAYAIVKTLVENTGELAAANALGKMWNKADAVSPIKGVIDMHPGAMRYYKEHGMM